MLTWTNFLVVAVYGASPRRESEIAILDLQNWIYKIRLLKGDDSRNDKLNFPYLSNLPKTRELDSLLERKSHGGRR